MFFAIIWGASVFVIFLFSLIMFLRSKVTEKDVVYLPASLFVFAVFLMLASAGFGVYAGISGKWLLIPVAAGLELVGIAAVLCRINQRTTMISEDRFVYKTFLGKKREYTFDDVVDVKSNPDSVTIRMKSGKIHVESMAVANRQFLDRLVDSIERK